MQESPEQIQKTESQCEDKRDGTDDAEEADKTQNHGGEEWRDEEDMRL